MDRRDLLASATGAGLVSLTGCVGVLGKQGWKKPNIPANRPKAVYYPTHVDGMNVATIKRQGDYTCALTYSRPQRFWLRSSGKQQKVTVNKDDSLHLMPIIWETETKVVPPDLVPQVKIKQDNEIISRISAWPMLSQTMGYHYGDNIELSGDGTYQVQIEVGDPLMNRAGALADDTPAQFTLSLEYNRSKVKETTYRELLKKKAGTRGAVNPMYPDSVPSSQLPKSDSLPGETLGTATSGDAVFVIQKVDAASKFGGKPNQTYLAASVRTPYNRYMVPMMSLSALLSRDGKRIFDGPLEQGIGPKLNFHYGAPVPSMQSGDKLKITIDAPTMTSRHDGYETAFRKMPPVQLTLSS